jgi:hypothetical protein
VVWPADGAAAATMRAAKRNMYEALTAAKYIPLRRYINNYQQSRD